MGAAMDGAMVHIREEGWKELKVGSLFEVGVQAVKDKETGAWTTVPQAQHNSYVAHLGGPAHFGELMWAEAQRRRWDLALDTQVVGDGAAWIWNLTNLHFGESHQVIDWYHAKEHLVAATRLLHPDENSSYERALKQYETLLFQGHARQLGDFFSNHDSESSSEPLKQEAQYFLNNHRRMNYMELREGLWLIGSGMVESEAKQFKHRFTASGMRWSREGLENIIPIRAAVMSDDFHNLWNRTFHPPLN